MMQGISLFSAVPMPTWPSPMKDARGLKRLQPLKKPGKSEAALLRQVLSSILFPADTTHQRCGKPVNKQTAGGAHGYPFQAGRHSHDPGRAIHSLRISRQYHYG
jgi:hypothetical protein